MVRRAGEVERGNRPSDSVSHGSHSPVLPMTEDIRVLAEPMMGLQLLPQGINEARLAGLEPAPSIPWT